jgi:cyclic-di-AMP phosphodiesterase PgpH
VLTRGIGGVGLVGNQVDDLHRSPTPFERFRGWIEGLPKARLYIALVLLSWASLTLLIGLNPRPPLERIVAQGVIAPEDLAQLESLDLVHQTNPWMALLGVALVVTVEMGMAWYFVERFGIRIFKTNAAVRIVLAASLTILFTALARFFIELDFNPYLTPLAGLSIIGTMLLGPRLTFLMSS